MADPGFRDAATPVVSAFYDRFPFPGDPLQDGPPPGYNWRWCHLSVLAAVHGVVPAGSERPRILDAGCGTGVSTDYLCHLNPGSDVLGIDISEGALTVARERLQRSGAAAQVSALRQEQRSLLDLDDEGPFDYINSVGVLHHLDQPEAGLRSLAGRLAPDGLLHLFLYADAGRWEIHRTQQALTLLDVGTGSEGLRLGRELFEILPEGNRLARHHRERWAVDCAADANFADMYLHPQETSYDLRSLWDFLAAAGFRFLGFSNPEQWDLSRVLQGDLLERAQALSQTERWLLMEALDPEISHFEFFVSNEELSPCSWGDDAALLLAQPRRSRCLWGWPGQRLLDRNLAPLNLSEDQFALLEALEACDADAPGLGDLPLAWTAERRCAVARELLSSGVLSLARKA